MPPPMMTTLRPLEPDAAGGAVGWASTVMGSQNSAVHLEHGAGDVARIQARQKAHSGGHFLRLPEPAQGNLHLCGLSFITRQMRQRLGFDEARADRVDGD